MNRLVPALSLLVACGVTNVPQSSRGGHLIGGVTNPVTPPATTPVTPPATTTTTTTPQAGTITDCQSPPISSDDCDYTPGSSALLIHADIIGPDALFKGGEVVISNGAITCAACNCESQGAGAQRLECAHVVVSPGLINSHDHITWASGAPSATISERFDHRDDWREGIEGHTKIYEGGSSSLTEAVGLGELRFLMGGATSTIASGSVNGFLRNLDTNTSGRQEGLTSAPLQYETFPLQDNNAASSDLLHVGDCNYVGFNAPQAGGGPWYPHISEGVNAAAENEFLCLSGGSETGAQNFIDGNTSIMHAIGLTAADAQHVAQVGASVVWAPRTNISLYGYTADVTLYDRLGINIALGTDWLLSGSMTLLREFKCVDDYNTNHLGAYFSDQYVVQMATSHAAKAAHLDGQLGSLAPGMLADLALFRENSASNGFRAVMLAEDEDVVMVMRGGAPLYGNASVLEALGSGDGVCDTVDVCGVSKRVCITSETALWPRTYTTLAALQTAAKHNYSLFFCGTPDLEPTCEPARNQGDGIVFTGADASGDVDGDGVSDASDNCPSVFNPPRPMDNVSGVLAQPDADGDGIGDACDPCPFVANSTQC